MRRGAGVTAGRATRCLLLILGCAGSGTIGAQPGAAPVPPQLPLQFPADEGAHPAWKTEWWYVTGWLQDSRGLQRGFQLTFFRNRGPAGEGHASRFAPVQIMLAHAALSDPDRHRIVHEERAARAGFDLAGSRSGALSVKIDDWSLMRAPDGRLVLLEINSNPAWKGLQSVTDLDIASVLASDFLRAVDMARKE